MAILLLNPVTAQNNFLGKLKMDITHPFDLLTKKTKRHLPFLNFESWRKLSVLIFWIRGHMRDFGAFCDLSLRLEVI